MSNGLVNHDNCAGNPTLQAAAFFFSQVSLIAGRKSTNTPTWCASLFFSKSWSTNHHHLISTPMRTSRATRSSHGSTNPRGSRCDGLNQPHLGGAGRKKELDQPETVEFQARKQSGNCRIVIPNIINYNTGWWFSHPSEKY